MSDLTTVNDEVVLARIREFLDEHPFTSFAFVPTNVVVPFADLRNGVFQAGIGAHSESAICNFQLQAIQHGYMRLLEQAETALNAPRTAALRAEFDAVGGLLAVYALPNEADTSDNHDWFNDWLEEISADDELPAFLQTKGARTLVMPQGSAMEAFEYVTGILGINHFGWSLERQMRFMKDFARWYGLNTELAYLEGLVVVLRQITSLLDHEQKTRDLVVHALELSRSLDNERREYGDALKVLSRQHTDELGDTRISTAVTLLKALGITQIGNGRREALFEALGEITAEQVIARVTAPENGAVEVPADESGEQSDGAVENQPEETAAM